MRDLRQELRGQGRERKNGEILQQRLSWPRLRPEILSREKSQGRENLRGLPSGLPGQALSGRDCPLLLWVMPRHLGRHPSAQSQTEAIHARQQAPRRTSPHQLLPTRRNERDQKLEVDGVDPPELRALWSGLRAETQRGSCPGWHKVLFPRVLHRLRLLPGEEVHRLRRRLNQDPWPAMARNPGRGSGRAARRLRPLRDARRTQPQCPPQAPLPRVLQRSRGEPQS